MRLFRCLCGQVVFFENVRCTQCDASLAYLPDVRRLTTIEQAEVDEPTIFKAADSGEAGGQLYRFCANSTEYEACNWAVPLGDDSTLCESCRLNDVIPDLSVPDNLAAWKKLESAKRRLIYSLRVLGLPVEPRSLTGKESAEGQETQAPPTAEDGMVFSFMADSSDGKAKVFTGHNEGAITINIAEADDPFREKLRKQLGEGYRTVLGHFRHEIGHYYWDRLVRDTVWLEPFRVLFGDESVSYEESLKRHYSHPPPSDWPLHYVSSYATMHPWEDWAETWAHYMHMVDTLETARGYGLALRPETVDGQATTALTARSIDFDDFDDLMRGWVPLTVALNSLNRSMGMIDPYPFTLTIDVTRKLRFVHDVVEASRAAPRASTPEVQEEMAKRWLTRQTSERARTAPQDPLDAQQTTTTRRRRRFTRTP